MREPDRPSRAADPGRGPRPSSARPPEAAQVARSPVDPLAPDPRLAFPAHPEPELILTRDRGASRDALERLGEEAWQVALDFLYDEAGRRAFARDGYVESRARFFGVPNGPAPAPVDGRRAEELLEEFRRRLAPYQMNAQHPRQFGYFTPPPLWLSIVGELLAQVVNQGVDVWHCGPTGAFVEEEVLRWLCDAVGYGAGSFGILTSGGVMANLVGLTLARDVGLARLLAGRPIRVPGDPDSTTGPALPPPPRGAALEGVRVYASDQAHFSIDRALDLLGYPPGTLRLIPSDEQFRLRGEAVAAAVDRDRAEGRIPLAIAAVAGSTNTGSVDRIGELADLADREDLWLHVDAAYGGAARLSPRDATRMPDLDRADSVTVDPHKWLFQAYDIGALLVRRRQDLLDTFHRSPEYYRTQEPEDEPLNMYQYGIEGTRRFRALKLWMSWKHLGTAGFGHLIEATNDLAAHLARRCAESDDFEAVPAVPELSVVCFRHLPGGRVRAPGLDPSELDAHQDRLQRALEQSGEGWLSTTTLRGRTWLRAGIVNYLATPADLEHLLAVLRRLATELGPD